MKPPVWACGRGVASSAEASFVKIPAVSNERL